MFFKKAKSILLLHFKTLEQLEHNKIVTEHLANEKKELDIFAKQYQEKYDNISLYKDQEQYIKDDLIALEDK